MTPLASATQILNNEDSVPFYPFLIPKLWLDRILLLSSPRIVAGLAHFSGADLFLNIPYIPMKTLKLLAATLLAASSLQTLHAQFPGGHHHDFYGQQPPSWSGSGGPILSGSGDSGFGGWHDGDHHQFGPPEWSGSGGPILSGSGGSQPPAAGFRHGLSQILTETLTIRAAFTPASTGTASTSGSATATGCVSAVNIGGTDTGSISIQTRGLTSGIYSLSGVSLSSTDSVALGDFTVRAGGPGHHGRGHGQCKFHGIILPTGFDPFAISSLAISDSNGNLLFTADLSTISDGAFSARAPLVSGSSGISGTATIKARAAGGVVTGSLKLSASGLPASTTYTYAVDGNDIATVTTTAGGRLRVDATEDPSTGTLPSSIDLFTVTTVTVHDSSNNVILSASF